MAGTNPDKPVVDDDKPVTEEDLRSLKYPEDEVETTKVEDETTEGDEDEEDSEETSEEDGQTADDATEEEDDESDDAPAFVKEFDYIKGDTPEEYAKNLELAYKNSTTEALRLKDELQAVSTASATTTEESTEDKDSDNLSPLELYAKQKMDQEIQESFDAFRKNYPQVADLTEYAKFTNEVATFAQSIKVSQKRLASPAELYTKAAISLGWEKKDSQPDDKDKLAMAAKNGAASSKTLSGPAKKTPPGPKISEALLRMDEKMYPGKTRQESIEELTPHLQ